MSAPLQRLPECTLAAIVATAVVFALNTAPSGRVAPSQALAEGGPGGDELVTGMGPVDLTASSDDTVVLVPPSNDPDVARRHDGDDGPTATTDASTAPRGLRNIGVLSEVPLEHGLGLERGRLYRGRRFGPWDRLDAQGRVVESKHYDDDLLEGDYTAYGPNGETTVRGQYAQDLREGAWEYFDADGNTIVEAHYEGGLRHGLWTRTYTDGSIREMGSYDRGKMVGQWIFRTPDGNLTRQSGSYVAGVKVSD
jgi:hypothetical protein